jgi:hypothetical protein
MDGLCKLVLVPGKFNNIPDRVLSWRIVDSNLMLKARTNSRIPIGQVSSLQPDFIEPQTCNDAGGFRYMVNSCPPERIEGTPILAYAQTMTTPDTDRLYPHLLNRRDRAMRRQQLCIQITDDTFWHHTLLSTGLGYPSKFLALVQLTQAHFR